MLGIVGNVSGINLREPSTWVMTLAGFAGLGLVARRLNAFFRSFRPGPPLGGHFSRT
jgi:hypothetical protein